MKERERNKMLIGKAEQTVRELLGSINNARSDDSGDHSSFISVKLHQHFEKRLAPPVCIQRRQWGNFLQPIRVWFGSAVDLGRKYVNEPPDAMLVGIL